LYIEHDGLRKDGQPDQRVQQDSFAYGKVDPHEAGKKGGQTSGTDSGSSSEGSENPQGASGLGGDGLRKDGQPDQRLKQNQ
jgi:general stress protein YciG